MRQHFRVRAVGVIAVVGALCLPGTACDDGSSPTELPPPSLPELFGDVLYRADGSTVGLEAFDGVPVIGIYFGSGGCTACGSFTPILVDAYDQLEAEGRLFEVVYVSSDRSEEAMFSYMQGAGMGWLAVPWHGEKASALVERYDIQWIPTLVIVDSTGATVSENARDHVANDGAAAYDDWLAAAYGG